MTIVLKFGDLVFPFVIEGAISYSLGDNLSIKVIVPIDIWLAMHINATIFWAPVFNSNPKKVTIQFFNVVEYEVIEPNKILQDNEKKILSIENKIDHDVKNLVDDYIKKQKSHLYILNFKSIKRTQSLTH